jgi:stage V sporulation protein AE
METFLMFVKAFLVGGAICTIGQIIINFTHLTNGRILVIFLIAGAILQAFGLYEKLIDFAGAGASVPISGFGCALVKGAVDLAHTEGYFGALKGGLMATAAGVSMAIVGGYLVAMISRPKTKKH